MKTDANGNLPPETWARIFVCLVALGMLARYVIVPIVTWL